MPKAAAAACALARLVFATPVNSNTSDSARKAGIWAVVAQPRSALKRNNRFAKTGIDEDFGKGSSAYNIYKGDPTHSPSPCLGPIEKGPFYAVKLMPGDFGTSLGLVTGSHGEVLDDDSRPIPGLYACGNDMNSPVSGHYIGAGITLGPALTFGYLAAMALAANDHGRFPHPAPQRVTVLISRALLSTSQPSLSFNSLARSSSFDWRFAYIACRRPVCMRTRSSP
ncbi:FAD-binding protein [Paraburkholderia sediminicola]|uniref:FAD-binding protein n=1 Tax=Paraburkholderia sediminicola TaxID=458836 RepID=UPI0038BA488B